MNRWSEEKESGMKRKRPVYDAKMRYSVDHPEIPNV
jgi:hypothetical protein